MRGITAAIDKALDRIEQEKAVEPQIEQVVGYPLEGESLADYQERIAAKVRNGENVTPADYRVPTPEEMRVAIKDSTTPEPVKRYLREQLYGAGGAGRKGHQQTRLQKQMVSLQENLKDRALGSVIHKHGEGSPKFSRPHDMSGRQWKRARKLMRQMAKIAVGGTGNSQE